MSAGMCGAQAPLLGAEAHRSRHAENEGKRKGSGGGEWGTQVYLSWGQKILGKGPISTLEGM